MNRLRQIVKQMQTAWQQAEWMQRAADARSPIFVAKQNKHGHRVSKHLAWLLSLSIAWQATGSDTPQAPIGNNPAASATQTDAHEENEHAIDKVILVLSSDAGAYQRAAEQAQKTLKAQGVANEVQTLAQATARQKQTSEHGHTQLRVGIGTQAAQLLAKHRHPEHPLIYCMVGNPSALANGHPDAIWGVSIHVDPKMQMAVIGQVLPKTKRVGVLYRSDVPSSTAHMQALMDSMPDGWQLLAFPINEFDSVAEATDAMFDGKPDVVYTQADSSVFDAQTVRVLILKSLRHRVPLMGFSLAFVRSGALFGVGVEPEHQGEQAAQLALQAIQGANHPAGATAARGHDNHWVVPPVYDFGFNQTVADQIGVRLDAPATAVATHVYGER